MKNYTNQLRSLFRRLKNEYKFLKNVKLKIETPPKWDKNSAYYANDTIHIFNTTFKHGLNWSLCVLLHEIRHAMQDINYVFTTNEWIKYETSFKHFFRMEMDADLWALQKFMKLYYKPEQDSKEKKKLRKFMFDFADSMTDEYYFSCWENRNNNT